MSKRYQIISADPPWRYNKRNRHDSFGGGVHTHYPTMSMDEIAGLPVQDLADDRCLLFLWCTFPYLDIQIQLFKKWGFTYKTVGFTWVKTYPKSKTVCLGPGFYSKSNAEVCLLGVKGKTFKPVVDTVSSVIISPRREHSQKPPEARERIELMYPSLSKIELFAREKAEGWDAWGNEVESDISLPVHSGALYTNSVHA